MIEPGTTIYFGYSGGLTVNNGGTLISAGTPENLIIYTSDTGYGWGDYYCAIFVEQTASPATKITYSYVGCAQYGIITDNIRLDTPIENNYLFYNVYGILEYGTHLTDIMNNLIYYGYNEYYYSSGIEVYMESSEGIADANSNILIQNNTCDYQDYGIVVYGTENENDAGMAVLANNIISGSEVCGLYICNLGEYVAAFVTNTGYYDNDVNKNLEFEEYNPVIATQYPYVDGQNYLDWFYLDPNSPFVDAGAGSPEEFQLMGKNTNINGTPDTNIVDIGFHHFKWDYIDQNEADILLTDLDGSNRIDFNDFVRFANELGSQGTMPQDFDGDGIVDVNDLVIICNNWLKELKLGITLNQPPDNIVGVLAAEFVGDSNDITCYLYENGQLVGRLFGEDWSIATYEGRNGTHQLKVIGVSPDDDIICGKVITIDVYNRLNNLTGQPSYIAGQSYEFKGFYEPNEGSTINLSIKDWDDEIIWSDTATGNFQCTVSANILECPYNDLVIEEESGGMMLSGELPDWIKSITRNYNISTDPTLQNAKSLLVGVKRGFCGFKDWTYNRREVWKQYLTACHNKGISPTICLFFNQATRENIRRAFALPYMKSIMIITDGNREVAGVHRTFFEAWDGEYFSYLLKNWGGGGDYELLPAKYERGYSVADQISHFRTHNRFYVFIDACKNGTSCMSPTWYQSVCLPEPPDNNYTEAEYEKTADMAHAFGIYNNPPYEYRLYMGWRGFALKGMPYWLDLTHYNNFLRKIWEDVGSSSSLYQMFRDAFSDAITEEIGNRIPASNFSYYGNHQIYFENY